MLFGGHTAAAPDSANAPSGLGSGCPPVDTYLTDGVSLYRVSHALPCPRMGQQCVALEDCLTLDLVLCPAEGLVGRGLCVVTPER